jgi:iron complex transport system ATP-binding protein
MLEAKEIVVQRGDALLLDGVSARVEPGRFVAVVGPNGAGKTTLMRILTGDLRPDSGEVLLEGTALRDLPGFELGRRLAVLAQQVELHFPLTVLETVLLGRSPHFGFLENEADLLAAERALEQVDMGRMAGRVYPTLSGGEQQRVNLARVLCQIDEGPRGEAARYLFLDEPTTGLDLRHQRDILEIARGLADQNTAVCAILHDLGLAARFADDLLLLDHGRIVAVGSPREVLTESIIREVFRVDSRVTFCEDAPEQPFLSLQIPT